MFRNTGILLYTHEVRDRYSRNIFFTEEYGKITTWERGKMLHTAGSLGELSIERKAGHNDIKEFSHEKGICQSEWSYREVLELLLIMETLYEALPEGVAYVSIFHDMKNLVMLVDTLQNRYEALLLVHLRIVKKLGYLDGDLFRFSLKQTYIYQNIDTVDIEKLLLSPKLTQEDICLIVGAIQEARYTAFSRI